MQVTNTDQLYVEEQSSRTSLDVSLSSDPQVENKGNYIQKYDLET